MRWCLSIALLAGCVTPGPVAPSPPGTVTLRPDGSPGPEPCPKDALTAMDIMRLHPGSSAWVDLDLNKQGQDFITVNDGPIESQLEESLGPVLGPSDRLYGKVWTSGPDVTIRYYQARPTDRGPAVPICAVARLGDGEMKKVPGPAPGSAILEFSVARLVIVDSFR